MGGKGKETRQGSSGAGFRAPKRLNLDNMIIQPSGRIDFGGQSGTRYSPSSPELIKRGMSRRDIRQAKGR